MMDLKEIIKWFIPCFHILRLIYKMIDNRLTIIFILLFINCSYASVLSGEFETKNNLSLSHNNNYLSNQSEAGRDLTEASGRTFGRPFKKMIAGLLPLIFQIGAASTWAVVAALVGIKTLAITLLILKLLLVAGAAKIGALFAQKQHHGWAPPAHGWEQHPQKEIHLHIHNNGHHEEHTPITAWNRDGTATASETKAVNVVVDPYAGPQTISTPYGNYVRVQPQVATQQVKKKK